MRITYPHAYDLSTCEQGRGKLCAREGSNCGVGWNSALGNGCRHLRPAAAAYEWRCWPVGAHANPLFGVRAFSSTR